MRAPLETVRQAYDAWENEEWDEFFDLLDRNIVFDVSSFPEGAVYRGHDGLLEGWRIWRGTWERYDVDIESCQELGERVLALTRVRALSKGHGVETEAHGADLWTVRDERIIRLEVFMDRHAGLRAAEAAGS